MMDWTDNHFRFLARLLSRHAWLYTEMVVDNTLRHQEDQLVGPGGWGGEGEWEGMAAA